MKKVLCCILATLVIGYGVGLFRDMYMLHGNVIRLHVVGASDDEADQKLKLQVKDAVNAFLQEAVGEAGTSANARTILEQLLPQIQHIAQQSLRERGSCDSVQVTLERETFPRREYDTFTLPSGVYESVRIRIGAAEGRNWWCVVFPSLCLPSAVEDLRDSAVGAGFSQELTNTITGEDGYEIRFFLLDLLGQLQNLWVGNK